MVGGSNAFCICVQVIACLGSSVAGRFGWAITCCGELMKLGTDLIEDMGASGLFRYIEGKASPILSGAITALTGREMTGGDIWKGDNPVMKNVVGFWHILTHMTPMPMAAPNAVSYMQREPADERSAMGWGALLTGLGRFSKPGSRRR